MIKCSVSKLPFSFLLSFLFSFCLMILFEDEHLVEFMYLFFICQVRLITIVDSGQCCCVHVTLFER